MVHPQQVFLRAQYFSIHLLRLGILPARPQERRQIVNACQGCGVSRTKALSNLYRLPVQTLRFVEPAPFEEERPEVVETVNRGGMLCSEFPDPHFHRPAAQELCFAVLASCAEELR